MITKLIFPTKASSLTVKDPIAKKRKQASIANFLNQ